MFGQKGTGGPLNLDVLGDEKWAMNGTTLI